MTTIGLRTKLREALLRLAEPPEIQVTYLQKINVWPSADELALELDDLIRLVPEAMKRGEISGEEEIAIRRVDTFLAAMSTPDNESLWDASQLEIAKEWEQVRHLAASAFKTLSEQMELE